jgi:hypothetical protein
MIVGIVQSLRLSGPERDLVPEFYEPASQDRINGPPRRTLVVRLTSPTPAMASRMSDAVRLFIVANAGKPEFLDNGFQALTAERRFTAAVHISLGHAIYGAIRSLRRQHGAILPLTSERGERKLAAHPTV